MKEKELKGKNTFTQNEIDQLKDLIRQRVNAPRNEQKSIRNKMRRIGFYGKDDWGITDCQISDLDALIKSGEITIIKG